LRVTGGKGQVTHATAANEGRLGARGEGRDER